MKINKTQSMSRMESLKTSQELKSFLLMPYTEFLSNEQKQNLQAIGLFHKTIYLITGIYSSYCSSWQA